MTNGELMQLLDDAAVDYVKDTESIYRNSHMNDIIPGEKFPQKVIDAVVVDFVNFVCMRLGGDYGMYTKDLRKTRNETK